MEQMIDILAGEWLRFAAFAPRIFIAVFVLIAFYFAGRYIANILTGILRRTFQQQAHESFFRATTVLIATFLGLIVALNILGLEKLAVSVMAGGGVTAIILGFAFREIGENFLAGIFLAFSRPFKTGDAIKTEDIEGKVQDIELRYTHLRTDDGRDVYVPSSQMFNKPVINFTKDGLRRISFTVGIDYSNDSKKACTLLRDTVQKVKGVLKEPGAGAYILNLGPQFVEIQAFFWVDILDKTMNALTIRTDVLDSCRAVLLKEAYIVSSETTSNIAIVNNPFKDNDT